VPNTKPFVQAAMICEHVLHEKDGVVSAIRVIDRITTGDVPIGLPAGVTPAVEFSILVMIKAGSIKGKSKLQVKMRRPSGAEGEVNTWPIQLNGDEQGANIVVKASLAVSEFGLYWFDVYWNGGLLTSIPLKLVQGGVAQALDKQSQ